MITSVVESIHAVPAAEWEHLARPAGFYLSHQWLAGEEEDPTATCAYALVRDRKGNLLAAAPLYLVRDEPNDCYQPDTVLPSHLWPRVIAGARRGYHNTPLTAPDSGPDSEMPASSSCETPHATSPTGTTPRTGGPTSPPRPPAGSPT